MYFSPSLVRRGGLALTHLRSLDNFTGCLPPTWDPRYSTELAPASSAGEFTQELVSSWGTTSTLRVLMTASLVQVRVPEETWGYFNSLRLEGPVRDFLPSALWKKLPVGDRIAVWVPHARYCPLCGSMEEHDHAVSICPNLGLASALISQLLPWPELGGIRWSATDLELNHVPASLSSAAGVLFWSAVSVNWSIGYAVSMSGPSRVPDTVFLRKRLQALRAWSGASQRYLPESELVLVEKARRARVEGSRLVHPRLLDPGPPIQGALPVVPAFAPGHPRLKPNTSTLRARFVLAIEPFLLAGWVAVYLDGSKELVHGVRIGGFGVCSDKGLSFSFPFAGARPTD